MNLLPPTQSGSILSYSYDNERAAFYELLFLYGIQRCSSLNRDGFHNMCGGNLVPDIIGRSALPTPAEDK